MREAAGIDLSPRRKKNSRRPVPAYIAYLQGRGRKMVEIARTNAGGALPQDLDRAYDSATDEQACHDGHAKAEQEENGSSEDGSIQGRVGLSRWALHQYGPAQVRDGGGSGEYLLTSEVRLCHP